MIRSMKDSKIEWAGKIPEHWREIPNKFLFYNSSEKVGDEAEHYQLLSLTTQGVKKKDKNATGGKVPLSYDNYQTVDVGDIIFCLFDLDCSAVFAGVSPYCGMITSAYDVLTPRDAVLYNKYADYWFQYAFSNRYYKLYSKNIRFAVTNDVFGSILTIIPPLAEQKKIADFLDGKCAEIDELVQTEEKMIEELKAYKQSVITEAVTKGLDPAAPMKDSGIEWIGKIPASWEVGRMKYVADINAPCKDVKQYERISYAPMECIKRGWMECQEISPLESSSGLTTFEENDIVMAKVTPCFENGNIAVAKDLINGVALGSSELFVFRARTVLTEWLFYFLQNSKFTDLAKSTMVGTGGLKRVSPKFVSNYQMGVPSLDEQKQIADYLDEKCAKIDEIIALRTEQINQLKEYKKSLIYEYVTGKKEAV